MQASFESQRLERRSNKIHCRRQKVVEEAKQENEEKNMSGSDIREYSKTVLEKVDASTSKPKPHIVTAEGQQLLYSHLIEGQQSPTVWHTPKGQHEVTFEENNDTENSASLKNDADYGSDIDEQGAYLSDVSVLSYE